jgi:hypothetical protein
VQVLVETGKASGFVCRKEPNLHVRPEGIERGTKGYNDHGDILMMRHCDLLYVDVQVCQPHTQTALLHASVAAQNVPLRATLSKEQIKTSKFSEIATLNKYTLFPFIMESLGGLGVRGQQLIKTLAKHAVDYTPQQLLQHIRRRLSVTLQIGNANALLQAMQQLHITQYEKQVSTLHSTSRHRRYYYQVTKRNNLPMSTSIPVHSNVLHRQLDRTVRNNPLTSDACRCDGNGNCSCCSTPVREGRVSIDFTCGMDSADIVDGGIIHQAVKVTVPPTPCLTA